MPIRFRCVYCDKLLGIARRKAGAVVNCPQCGQPLIVPNPEPEPAAATAPPTPPSAAGRLFEREDFEAMLQGDVTLRTPDGVPPRRARSSRGSEPAPLPPRPFPVEQSLPAPRHAEPAELAPRPRPAAGGVVLSTGVLIVLLIAALILVGGAFGAGILVGRMLH
jgi:hypothetical protein